jgi:hypothetical protein
MFLEVREFASRGRSSDTASLPYHKAVSIPFAKPLPNGSNRAPTTKGKIDRTPCRSKSGASLRRIVRGLISKLFASTEPDHMCLPRRFTTDLTVRSRSEGPKQEWRGLRESGCLAHAVEPN